MKEKINVRYLGFRSAGDGGRLFDFCVSATEHPDLVTSFEIPAQLFAGADRIRLQEGVGICYAKLKHLIEIGASPDVPDRLCLSSSDVAQYRDVLPARRSGWNKRESEDVGHRKTS